LIGVLVKLEREEDGWTQWELAEEAGVCTGTVSRLEKFKTKSPHLRTTIMILTALGHEIQVGRRADRVMDAIEKVG
jgi:transcriptional regulator with XRE-family HTH domain